MNPTLCFGLMTIALSLLSTEAPPRVVWNATISAPRGWWVITRDAPLQVGDWALVRPAADLAPRLAMRGYLPPGVSLLKQVAAGPGQSVCRRGRELLIDGRVAAVALASDRMGRPLPAWSGCRRLGRAQVFFMNAAPDSLDGRYFGPTPHADVVGRAEQLRLREVS